MFEDRARKKAFNTNQIGLFCTHAFTLATSPLRKSK